MSENVQSHGQFIAAMCIMQSREVTFMHRCDTCEGVLHVPCVVTIFNEKHCAKKYWAKSKSTSCANTQAAIATIEERSQNTQAYAERQAATATAASTLHSQAAKATMTETFCTVHAIAHPAPIVPPSLTAASSAQNQKRKKKSPSTTS